MTCWVVSPTCCSPGTCDPGGGETYDQHGECEPRREDCGTRNLVERSEDGARGARRRGSPIWPSLAICDSTSSPPPASIPTSLEIRSAGSAPCPTSGSEPRTSAAVLNGSHYPHLAISCKCENVGHHAMQCGRCWAFVGH